MKSNYMKTISALLVMSIVFIFASCGTQPASVSSPVSLPVSNPVEYTPETASVIRTNLSYSTVQSAVAIPRVTQDLSFGMSGTISLINVGMLDFVREGDVLAELDPADYLDRIERNEIDMQMLELRKQMRELDESNYEYTLSDARDAYNNARRYGNRDNINRRLLAIQRAELNIEIARLNDIIFELDYEKAHESREQLISNIDKTILMAPSDGYILYDATLVAGDTVESKTPVFTFVSTSDILLHITSRDAIHFRGQERVNVTIGDASYVATVYTPVRSDAVWASKIPSSQMFLEFRNAPSDVEVDSTVLTNIRIEKENALAVPRRSIRTITGSTYVDVLEGDSIINIEVELGIVSGGLVEIVSGLSEGDIVVVG